MDHKNILKVTRLLKPDEDFEDVYIVTDLLENDLGAIIKSK